MRNLRHRHPDADVQTLHLAWDEPHTALLDHRVDAVVARLPFPTGQLHVTVLYDEPRVLLVPLDHRLAGKESVTLDDIANATDISREVKQRFLADLKVGVSTPPS